MSEVLDINFHKDGYRAGDIITGDVILRLEEEAKIRGVLIHFCGKSRNGWYNWWQRCYYHKSETYIDNQTCILPQGGKDTDGRIISAGKHSFPFEFQLPNTVPCSFDGGVGWVRYHAKAVVDRMWKICDFTCKKDFTVFRDYDVNDDDNVMVGEQEYIEEGSSSLFSGQPVKLKVKCDKGGYNIDDVINVDVDIVNQSSNSVRFIKCSLVQKQSFEGRGWCTNVKKVDKEVSKIKQEFGCHGNVAHWSGTVTVPTTPPSDLNGCSIIKLAYELKIKVHCGRQISVGIPLRIGSGPIKSKQDTLPAYKSLCNEDMFAHLQKVD